MIRMFVRHDVHDYDKWRHVYDEFEDERTEMGVRGDAVYQSVDNDNDVTVHLDFDSMDLAHSFAESPRLREVMREAGVSGPPDLWFVKED